MAYTKQEFIDLETIITADHMNNFQDGITAIYDDLYDEKFYSSYDFVHQTINISSPKYTNEYATSTFSGWWGCIGNPKNFNSVRFPVKVREEHPLSSIEVRILEMPAASEVIAATRGVTPTPKSWKIIASTTVDFEKSPEAGLYQIITADFDKVIENADGKYLFLAVLCSDLITMGFFKTTYDDIEYNPWIYYATNGGTGSTYLGVGTYDYNSKDVYTLAADFYLRTNGESYITIGTEKKDKFFNLVNDCLNNSDSFGEIFQEAYKPNYVIGSQNLVASSQTKYPSTTSTFTGILFPIGVIPKDQISDGCMLKIRARSYNGSTKSITKVWAYLYSVDSIPYNTGSQYAFSTLNPVLLRSGSAECDIAVDTEDVVLIKWNEGEFSNIDGKFLMLGYCCDTYSYRCYVSSGKSGKDICSQIDGNAYSDHFDVWYSTVQDGSERWSAGTWNDTTANAWSLIITEKYYDLGDKFYNLLDAALDEALIDTRNIAPTSEVRLAKQYDLVVGDTFQLYYSGVIKAFTPEKEGIAVRCSKGKEYPRYWEYTPTEGEEGTYTLQMYTRQLDGTIISQGSTKIVVHSKLTNDTTPSNLTCLVFGDSLTSSGSWAAEGLRRIYGATDSDASGPISLGVTNTVTTYGTKTNTVNTFKISHEGYGGWTWNSFLTPERGSDSTTNGIVVTLGTSHNYDLDTVQKSIWTDNNGKLWELEDFPSDTQIKFNRGEGNSATQKETATPASLSCGTLSASITPISVVWETTNPFYDEATQSLDFVAHATAHGAGVPDIISCLLTWNGGGGTLDFNQEAKISVHIDRASQLLRKIHEDCPNAKIIVMGIQISSLTGGTGYNYGADGGYADMFSTAFYAFDYNKALEELVTNSEFGVYCYYVDTKGQFDTIYNMPFSDVNVNTRNSSRKEMRGTNGVHPSQAGYYQIGDAFYRALTKVIPTCVKSATE